MRKGHQPDRGGVSGEITQELPPSQVVCPKCGAILTVASGTTPQSLQCPKCKADVAAKLRGAGVLSGRDPLLGAMLGGCRILDRIGQGAVAVVYRAEQVKLRRPVALKLLLPGFTTGGPGDLERFLLEARLAAQVEHPNIVQVYDVGEEHGHHFIVMQFVDGGSVRDLLDSEGRMPADRALELVLQAARGLDAAHACGVLHRDIKPSNLLLDRRGGLRIGDFGLARSVRGASDLTRHGGLIGTPLYMSPEQCKGEKLDARSDLYSLGVTMFEMLVGKRPFEGETAMAVLYKHLHEPVPTILRAAPAVTAPVASLVERLMAKEPGERCASAAELARELERLLGGRVPAAPAAPAGPAFDDRLSFRIAEAAMAVIRQRCPKFADDDAVWEAFIVWRGAGEREYLRRIRAGGKFIFYSVLHDLYDFAEEVCGQNVAHAVGAELTDAVLRRHMPDILQSTLASGGRLHEQILWLVNQVVGATTGALYALAADPASSERLLRMAVAYRGEKEMVDSLRRSGREPERAFANSFGVFHGALAALLPRVLYAFRPEQLQAEVRGLRGAFRLAFRDENRFHYENFIDILLDYVRRLRERREPAAGAGVPEANLHVSPAMRRTWERVRKAAASEETVLLCGESGTGKSYYARVVHDLGGRRDGPFVEVGLTAEVGSDNLIQSNLFGHARGAFTGADEEKQGLFALADGGTIFLDEIGDASPELQAKLLRVIEKKTFKMLGGVRDLSVNVRIIVATNKDLAKRVQEGRFREDLFYRLNVIRIELPPLRERAEDLPALVQRLFERVCADARKPWARLADRALAALRAHTWPGNIRELENALRHALAFAEGSEVQPADFPSPVSGLAAPPSDSPLTHHASRVAGNVIDPQALRGALATPQPPGTHQHEWPAHIDYAKREYLKALIDHYGGDVARIAGHWDRSSENTLLKLIRELGLEEHLRAARKARQ